MPENAPLPEPSADPEWVVQLPDDAKQRAQNATAALVEGQEQPFNNFLAAVFGKAEVFGVRFSKIDPPHWVHKLAVRTMATMVPGFPQYGINDTPHDFGRLLGIISRWLPRLENSPEGQEHEIFRRKEMAAAIKPFIAGAVGYAAVSTAPEEIEFIQGFSEGVKFDPEIIIKKADNRQIGGTHFVLYLFLILKWPEIEALGSSTALHQYLSNLKVFAVGDLESFQHQCRDLGLFKGKRGRPRKNRSDVSKTAS